MRPMNALYSLLTILGLALLAYGGAASGHLEFVLGAVVPLVAIAVFLAGLSYRVVRWAWTPVPFRIPTTCGQGKSLPWIRSSRLDNPSTTLGVVGRMALEVFLFRSLFRNTEAELRSGPRLIYGENKWLWLAAMIFHWSFLIIFVRHLRLFMEPVPAFVNLLAGVDGFFQVAAPVLYATDVAILASLSYLLYRRMQDSRMRYLSLFTDYFALFLILALASTGILMRYFFRVDTVAAKQLALGIATLHPAVPAGLSPLFFVHVFLLSLLLAYFPFSKLMHAPGVFLSPTRNLANDNRMRRHVNPWDYPVKIHTYQEWEEEFHDKIKAAGLPLERE
jgi:nitrate reductase gamma subunit